MYTTDIKQLFGKKKPSVINFTRAIKHFPLAEQQIWKEKVFITSFCYYDEKGKTFRAFLDNFTNSYRQKYLEYIHNKTLVGQNRYPLQLPKTVQKMIVSTERTTDKPKSSQRHLAFCLQLAFYFKPEITIDTQCNQMTYDPVQVDDLWEWYEKLKISDLYQV